MLTDQSTQQEVVIACNPNAIPGEEREAWIANGKTVYAAAEAVQELPDGYAFRLPSDSTMLLKVAEYIKNERLCCAFLHFRLDIEPNGGPLWLSLTGSEGVKAYIRSIFLTSELLNPEVVKLI